jgi:hypothetical protein
MTDIDYQERRRHALDCLRRNVEVFHPHPSGKWMVSSMGTVKRPERTLVVKRHGRPYTQTIPAGDVTSWVLVSRAVLETFVGPRPPEYDCCHFPDPSHDNNRLDNLRWDTKSENAKDAVRHGTCPLLHLTPEERSEHARSVWAKLTPEEQQRKREKLRLAQTSEERSEIARKTWAAMTPDQQQAFREACRKGWADRTPEQRKRHREACRRGQYARLDRLDRLREVLEEAK